MPGNARSWESSMRATGSPHADRVSAAVRYARILNAFSPLISSRSAISAKTCATCLLSTRETVPFDAEIEQARAAGGKGVADRAPATRRPIAEQAPAAAGAANFGGGCACAERPRDEVVDRRRGHPRSKLLASVPLCGDGGADRVPVLSRERVAHRRRGVA